MENEFKIRSPKPEDLNFILDTFYKSMRKESGLGGACSTRVFASEFQQVIDYILSVSQILLVCSIDDDNVIFAYLIYEQGVIHYAFTKLAFRKLGLLKALLGKAFPDTKSFYFSLSTKSAKKIIQDHPQYIFNPFKLYKKGAA